MQDPYVSSHSSSPSPRLSFLFYFPKSRTGKRWPMSSSELARSSTVDPSEPLRLNSHLPSSSRQRGKANR